MIKQIATIILLLISGFTVSAQTPDSLLKPSPVKTITAQQYNALMKGEDQQGMSTVADLNGFPSPDKALKFKKELDLSPNQVTALTKMATELKRKKIEMGNFIVTNETKLDALFKAKRVNESDLIFYTNRFGLYQGELRNAILLAAVKTWQLLSPQQSSKLQALKNHN